MNISERAAIFYNNLFEKVPIAEAELRRPSGCKIFLLTFRSESIENLVATFGPW
jgi:hypothetical protein